MVFISPEEPLVLESSVPKQHLAARCEFQKQIQPSGRPSGAPAAPAVANGMADAHVGSSAHQICTGELLAGWRRCQAPET